MTNRLITMPFSHFCEKARWALDRAGATYAEDGHCPGLHRFAVKRAGGKSSVPVLVTDGGEVLTQSADIVRFADAGAAPGRKLYPSDGKARADAEQLEQEFDATLGPDVRRLAYFHLLPRRAETFRLFDLKTPRAEQVAVRVVFPLLRRLMKRMMRIDDAGAQKSRDRTRRAFDDVGARLADGRPFLTGDRFSSADIAFAAFTAPVIVPEEHPVMGASSGLAVADLPPALADEISYFRGTPAGRFAARLYRECRQVHSHRD